MARYFNNDLEYLEADYSHMIGFEDDGEFAEFNHQISDSGNQVNDTTAAEYRNGKDMQGIPWESLNSNRDKYREMRLKQYQNFRSLSGGPVDLRKECKEVNTGGTFYNFQSNTRAVKPTIVHFQGFKAERKYFLGSWHIWRSFPYGVKPMQQGFMGAIASESYFQG